MRGGGCGGEGSAKRARATKRLRSGRLDVACTRQHQDKVEYDGKILRRFRPEFQKKETEKTSLIAFPVGFYHTTAVLSSAPARLGCSSTPSKPQHDFSN